MFSRLFLLFIIVPAVELYLLIEIGAVIGFLPTLGLICLTGIIGGSLARQQGLSVWAQFNSRLQTGQLPGKELVDGLIILVSGALLLTPGVITDVVGFLGLLPFSRALIRKYAQSRIKIAQANGSIQFGPGIFGSSAPPPSSPATSAEPQWQGTPKEKPDVS